jgi:hypothetical protein
MPKDPTIAIRDCLAEIKVIETLTAKQNGAAQKSAPAAPSVVPRL